MRVLVTGELPGPVEGSGLRFVKVRIAVAPDGVLIRMPSLVGVIVSVKFVVSLVLVLLSVNFSVNTSVISFCTSGDNSALLMETLPPLIWIIWPAWLTVAIGSSVTLSNRM